MKVFISWSGETSKQLAIAIKEFLPNVIQAVRVYFSPDDLTKGSRWNSEISKELDESKIGIICLVKENREAPWIMFEAGAISKNIDNSKVCPILFDMDPSDLTGPLTQFQGAKFSKEELFKVLNMINLELQDQRLPQDTLNKSFEVWWPEFEIKIQQVISSPKPASKTDYVRPDREILEEVLGLTRQISLNPSPTVLRTVGTSWFREVFETINDGIARIDLITDEQIVLGLCHTFLMLLRRIGELLRRSRFPISRATELENMRKILLYKIREIKNKFYEPPPADIEDDLDK